MKINPKVTRKFAGAVCTGHPEWKPKPSHIDLFTWLAGCPDATEPLKDALLVLGTPRCGSTLFCEVLNSSNRIGYCDEWFNYEYFAAYIEVLGVEFSLQDYVNFIARKTMRDTGVFALKWHVGQIVGMNKDFDLGMESMDFRHVVYLYRQDKIAQAVSLLKASITGQFRSYEREKKSDKKVSRHGIVVALEPLIRFDRFCRQYLWKYVDEEYAYEDFRDFSHPCYNDVLRAMGKPSCGKFSADKMKKQGDRTNDDAGHDFLKYITGERI